LTGHGAKYRIRYRKEEMSVMAQFFKRPEATCIGLHAMGLLAGTPKTLVSTKRIATLLEVSEAHLAKVLQRLERAGLVRGTRGSSGGFELAKPASKINLKEICEAIEGPFELPACPFDVPACKGLGLVGREFVEASRKLLKFLADTRLSAWQKAAGLRLEA
jgi:Rrf2 family protein